MQYIAIEGIDTAGKSTQILKLKQKYPDAIITKEPGATPLGEKIRSLVLSEEIYSTKAEFLLFLADRAEHINKVIKPNKNHKMIISDRSAISGIAYALAQKTITKEELLYLNNFATEKLYPEKIFLLQLTEKELHFRLSQKKLDGIELRGISYLLEIQENLINASKLLNIEFVIIDATQSKEDIHQQIINQL